MIDRLLLRNFLHNLVILALPDVNFLFLLLDPVSLLLDFEALLDDEFASLGQLLRNGQAREGRTLRQRLLLVVDGRVERLHCHVIVAVEWLVTV